jgi:hypothetical protein
VEPLHAVAQDAAMAFITDLQRAESRMREVLAQGDLPEPDDVEYRDDSVVFLWHDTKTAVVVDVEDCRAAAQPERTGTSIV